MLISIFWFIMHLACDLQSIRSRHWMPQKSRNEAFVLCILNRYILLMCFSDNSLEIQSLGRWLVLLNTLAHHSEEQSFSILNFALHLVASYVWISKVRMECDFKIQVGVRVNISVVWIDSEVLTVCLAIPFELSLYISEVRQLKVLSQSTTFHNTAKSQDFIH